MKTIFSLSGIVEFGCVVKSYRFVATVLNKRSLVDGNNSTMVVNIYQDQFAQLPKKQKQNRECMGVERLINQ